jgi:hypothetical protein
MIEIENRPIDKYFRMAGGAGNIESYRHSNKYNLMNI